MPRKNRTKKGPDVFVRSSRKGKRGGRRVSREEFAHAVQTLPAGELEKRYDRKVRQGFLEQDFTKGRGRDDRPLVKHEFSKFDHETVKRAAEGRDR